MNKLFFTISLTMVALLACESVPSSPDAPSVRSERIASSKEGGARLFGFWSCNGTFTNPNANPLRPGGLSSQEKTDSINAGWSLKWLADTAVNYPVLQANSGGGSIVRCGPIPYGIEYLKKVDDIILTGSGNQLVAKGDDIHEVIIW